MARNPSCTVYVGNLDEKVTDRILYEILIQVGHIVDLHIPFDKETNRHKGYAFAEYENEETAEYAVRLFSGLVRLYNRTLKFGISGQDKPSQNTSTPVTPKTNSTPLPRPHSVRGREGEMFQGSGQTTDYRVSAYISGQDKPSQNTSTPVTPKTNSTPLLRPHSVHGREGEMFQGSGQTTDYRVSAYTYPVTPVTPMTRSPLLPRPYPPHVREMAMFSDSSQSINCRVSAYTHSLSPSYPQAPARGYVNNVVSSSNLDYSRQVFGSMLTNINSSDSHRPIVYSSYSNH